MSGDEDLRQLALAWRREISALMDVRSVPGVAHFIAASPPGSTPSWLVLAEAPGRTAEDLIEAAGPVPLPVASRVADALAAALAHIHLAGWLHLDLNPRNVMLSQDRVTLLDFGAVQRRGRPSPWTWPLGRHRFMAPEHLQGRAEVPRYRRLGTPADVHQLACLVAFLLTGRQPFEACGAAEDYRTSYLDRLGCWAAQPGPAKAGELLSGTRLPSSLRLALARALDPVPERRSTLAGFTTALRQAWED